MSKKQEYRPDGERIWADWRVLCEQIGERRAGTEGERRAAEFLACEFESAGADVAIETFGCTSLRSGRAQCQVRVGRRWQDVDAAPVVGAPASPGRKWIDGRLAWFEMPEQVGRLKPGCLDGRIAMLFGPMPTDPAEHMALMAARPAAVIHVDERIPHDWVKNDGSYPYWVKRYGWPVFVTVPYPAAWGWRRDGIARARLRVTLDQVQAESTNVVATLPGTDEAGPMVYLSAHHDTQCNNVGADDNASGCVALLELARVLGARRRKRTIRLICFGTEEQLSVGSGAYAKAHRRELGRVGMLLNIDAIGSVLGHMAVAHTLGERSGEWLRRALQRRGLSFRFATTAMPFTDHFPFAVLGVPTVNFFRGNVPGGRWQHHSVHDNLLNVSVEPVGRVLAALAPTVHRLANMPEPPFGRDRDPKLTATLRRNGRVFCGLR